MGSITIPDRSHLEDSGYDDERQRKLDEEEVARAKRAASGFSPEELSLQDARIAGAEAGMRGTAAALNPYQDFTPEHAEWERHRLAALATSLARMVA